LSAMTNFRAQDMPGSPKPVAEAPVEPQAPAAQTPAVEPEAPEVKDETPEVQEPANEQESEALAEAAASPTVKRTRRK